MTYIFYSQHGIEDNLILSSIPCSQANADKQDVYKGPRVYYTLCITIKYNLLKMLYI